MIPLNIALGPKAVRVMLDNTANRAKFEQHCLIYSEKMLEVYIDINTDAAESMMGYIDAHEGEVGFSKEVTDALVGKPPIEQLLEKMCPKEERYFPQNIVILYEDDQEREVRSLGKNRTNILTTREIESNPKNVFTMLSPNTCSYDVDPGDNCQFWAEYFARIIEGEEKVVFMNRYGLKKDSIECLKRYYLPYLSKDLNIEIYASDSYSEVTRESVIKLFEEDDILKSYNINVYLINNPCEHHERWIQTNNYYIYQGKGFDMLNNNSRKKISSTSTVIVERRQRKLPDAYQVI